MSQRRGRVAVVTSAGMVGRRDELSRVEDRLDQAGDGGPGVVVVAGDAGVGKTRFVRAVAERAQADGWRVLVGACVELSEGAAVLAPVAGVLRQLARERGDAVLGDMLAGPARWLAPLVPELDVDTDGLGGGSGVQVLVSFHRLLRDLADEQPALLVLEDLHWADATTRDLLLHLASRLDDERLLVMATVRTDDLDRRHPMRPVLAEVVRRPNVDRIDLAPLADADVLAHLTAIAGDDHGLDLSALVARAGGNPFYAEELLAAGGEGLPPSLEDVLSLRLERLPGDTRQLLGEAAVLGMAVDPTLLRAVTRLEPAAVRPALRAALDDGVLVMDGDGYAFRHALLREVALDRLLPDERTAAHAAAAAALEADPDRAVIGRAGVHGQAAHHWWEARDVPRCLTASVAATAEAERVFADGLILRHSRRAVELWDRVDDPEALTGTTYPPLLLRAARAAADLEDPQARELATATIRAADEAGEERVRAEATELLTRYLLFHGYERDALELAAAERARHGDARTTAAALALVAHASAVGATGWAEADGWDIDAVAADLDEAASIADEHGDWTTEFRAHVEILANLAPFLPDRLGTSVERLFHLSKSPDYDNWAHGLAGWVQQMVGAFAEQQAALERAPVWNVDVASMRSMFAQWSMRVLNDTWYGRLDAALSRIDDADLRDQAGQAFVLTWMVAVSGDALRWTDQVERALRRAELAASVKGRGLVFHVAAELAACRAAAGATPREVVAAAHGTSGSFGMFDWHPSLAKLVAAVAEAAGAQRVEDDVLAQIDAWLDHFERFVDWLRDDAPVRPWATACLHWARAERAFVAGDPEPALWDPVVADFDARGGVPRAAIARLRRATARAAADGGSSPEVEDDLLAAWTTFTDLGMTALQDDAVALARRLRIRLPGLADGSDDGEVLPALTDREREVLAFVAQGWTNKRVGEHLFISPKTVSVHLSNAMRKLDVDSRTQAVLAARRAGLTAAD